MADIHDTRDDSFREDASETPGPRPGVSRVIGEFAILIIVAWLLAAAFKTWVVQPFVIPSGSMERTLLVGDRVLVSKFQYAVRDPLAGDIVVFESPDGDSRDFIKRVIAVAGQTVEIRSGVVFVDGVRLEETYVDSDPPDHYTSGEPFLVPAGSVFLMGDHRGASLDSRVFGAQPVSHILGRAFAIYWPVSRAGKL